MVAVKEMLTDLGKFSLRIIQRCFYFINFYQSARFNFKIYYYYFYCYHCILLYLHRTREDCERACPPAKVCELPLVAGPCYGNFPSWGSKNGCCIRFTYGGCQGNANRFR